jgi:predicted branched-subunit amino acid permease
MGSMQRTVRREMLADLRDAGSLSSAMGLVGLSYGALAPTAGLSPFVTVAMSVLVFAGGAQLLVLGVLVAGGGVWPAVLAGLVLNLRNIPFGLVLAPFVRRGWRVVPAAYGVTDGTTAFVLSRTEGTPGRPRRAFWTFGIVQFVCWQLGTVLGLLLGSAVPDADAYGLDAAFPAALAAMLMALLRKSDARRVAAASAAISLTATPFLPVGIPVLLALLGVGAAGRRRSGIGGRTPGGTDPAGTPTGTDTAPSGADGTEQGGSA